MGFWSQTLRKECLFSKIFWSAFSRIQTEYEEIRSVSPHSAQMREMRNKDQNNSEYGRFLLRETNNVLSHLTRRMLQDDITFHFKD